MDFAKAYNEARARAEKAEARVRTLEGQVKDLEGQVKSGAEDIRLREALRAAGATKAAAGTAVYVLRRSTEMLDFADDGQLRFAQFNGRVYRDADELAAAFIEANPNFTQAHADAVAKANGNEPAGSFENMSAIDLAEAGLKRHEQGRGAPAHAGSTSPKAGPSGDGILDQLVEGLEKAVGR